MYSVEVKVSFRYGHRLVAPYSGKCRNLHGEYGTAIFVIECSGLDENGFVVDFGVVKKDIKSWIDDNWDHAYLHHTSDEVGIFLKEKGLRTFDMGSKNPTAENMAQYLYDQFKGKYWIKKVGIVESSPDSIAWYVVL